MKLKRFLSFAIPCGIIGLFLAWVWLALPKPPLTEGIDFSTRVRDRNGNVLRVTLTSDQKYRIWTPLHDISPALIDATVQFEDKYFAQHPGVNPVPVMRAAWNLVRSGRARGRFDHHDATGAAAIPSPHPHARRKMAADLVRNGTRATLLKERDPRSVSQPRALRAKHRRRGRGERNLFRQNGRAFDRTGSDRSERDSAKPESPRAYRRA